MTSVAGTETLRWPKCSNQGDVLVVRDDGPALRLVVRRHGTERWDDIGRSLPYPQWTGTEPRCAGLPTHSSSPASMWCSKRETTLAKVPFPPVVWIAASWMGLDANDHLLVLADRGTTTFYGIEWERP